MAFQLRCPTCPDPFDPPTVAGVPTLRPDLLTVVQTANGPRFVPICPQCADAILTGTPVGYVSPV